MNDKLQNYLLISAVVISTWVLVAMYGLMQITQ